MSDSLHKHKKNSRGPDIPLGNVGYRYLSYFLGTISWNEYHVVQGHANILHSCVALPVILPDVRCMLCYMLF